MSHLNKIVRRVLIETEEQEPSYWDEVGKTVDRYGRAIGGLGKYAAAAVGDAAETAVDVLGAVARAAVTPFVGQAHAPRDEEDIRWARETEYDPIWRMADMTGEILSHIAVTKFRIQAKLSRAAGYPAEEILTAKYSEEFAKDILAGSVLHDVLLGASFVPGAAVAAMLLDAVVYTAEGDEESAILALAMAGVFHAGGKVVAGRADDAARGVLARKGGVEILAPKRYTDLNAAAKRGGFTHAVPPKDSVTAIVEFVDDAGARMEAAGVKGGRGIAASASKAVRSGEISIAPALEGARVAEAQKCASALMTPGPSGETPLAAASRIKRAYDDIKAAAKRNLDEPEFFRYADRPAGGISRANTADNKEGGTVPDVLSPKAHTAGTDILRAWKANADEQFFKREVKPVHWLGFSSFEHRSAAKVLDDFLEDAAVSKNVQISTIGYTEQVNPGPRAGVSFRNGPQGRQIQVGIKLKGDVVYATSEDAFTTNPRSFTRGAVASAKAGESPPPTFIKVPRPRYMSEIDVAMISDPNNPLYDAKLRAEMLRDIEAAKEAARANFDRTDPSNINKNPTDGYGQYLPSRWDRHAPARVFPAPESAAAESMLMLDRDSWREPFVDTPSYNEVVLDEWAPDAIYLNPGSATKEQIGQIKAVADKHGLELLDLGGGPIVMSHFEPIGRSGYPLRQSVDPESMSFDSPSTIRKGRTVYTGITYKPVKEAALEATVPSAASTLARATVQRLVSSGESQVLSAPLTVTHRTTSATLDISQIDPLAERGSRQSKRRTAPKVGFYTYGPEVTDAEVSRYGARKIDVQLPAGTKVLDVTSLDRGTSARITKAEAEALLAQGVQVIRGRDLIGPPEYVILDRSLLKPPSATPAAVAAPSGGARSVKESALRAWVRAIILEDRHWLSRSDLN